MSDEAKLAGEMAKGARAKQLLESDVYRESIAAVRQGIHDKWSKSPIRDTEGQHELRLMLKVLDEIEGNIRSVANTGKLAETQLAHDRTLKQRAKEAAAGLIAKFT